VEKLDLLLVEGASLFVHSIPCRLRPERRVHSQRYLQCEWWLAWSPQSSLLPTSHSSPQSCSTTHFPDLSILAHNLLSGRQSQSKRDLQKRERQRTNCSMIPLGGIFNPFPSISFHFLLFPSISFYFLLFPSISFYFLLFPSISSSFRVHFKSISSPFQVQVHFKSISSPFQVHFKSISSPFQVHFKSISFQRSSIEHRKCKCVFPQYFIFFNGFPFS